MGGELEAQLTLNSRTFELDLKNLSSKVLELRSSQRAYFSTVTVAGEDMRTVTVDPAGSVAVFGSLAITAAPPAPAPTVDPMIAPFFPPRIAPSTAPPTA